MLNNKNKYWIEDTPNFQINEIKWKFYHTDNLLHIHIPKCGGTWLKQIVYNTLEGHHRFNFGHLPGMMIKQILDERGYNWDDFKPFAIVRNPWDRLWSAYKYTKWGGDEVNLRAAEDPKESERGNLLNKQNWKQIHPNSTTYDTTWLPVPDNKLPIYQQTTIQLKQLREDATESVQKGWIQNNMLTKSNFKEYITNLHELIKPTKYQSNEGNRWDQKGIHNIYLTPQIQFVIDNNKEIIIPNIFKSTEMGKFIDWAEKNSKDKDIKSRSLARTSYNKSTNQIHYKNVYDDDMVNMVGELYRDDIKNFNFDYNI